MCILYIENVGYKQRKDGYSIKWNGEDSDTKSGDSAGLLEKEEEQKFRMLTLRRKQTAEGDEKQRNGHIPEFQEKVVGWKIDLATYAGLVL